MAVRRTTLTSKQVTDATTSTRPELAAFLEIESSSEAALRDAVAVMSNPCPE
ncbi:hypothetical protein ACFZAE_00810 [Streptomyces scabiei]|uniref:hypothetical protein n=1 Tax=Streptomyces scabiei TaxID=1930 RepID=UPI0036EE83AE